MTLRTKDAVILSIIIIGGIAVAIGDLHRTILQAAWPFITAFFDYLAQ